MYKNNMNTYICIHTYIKIIGHYSSFKKHEILSSVTTQMIPEDITLSEMVKHTMTNAT